MTATTATIIQFVPRANPNRDLNALEIAALDLIGEITEPADTAPAKYCAPPQDSA